jgi:hypothetical protein
MTSPKFLDELDQFVDLIAPAYAAAVEAAWAEAGRPLSPAEVEEILQRVLHEKAPDIFRQIHGANVMAAIDGKKPQ